MLLLLNIIKKISLFYVKRYICYFLETVRHLRFAFQIRIQFINLSPKALHANV
jgi:hypothetical protein